MSEDSDRRSPLGYERKLPPRGPDRLLSMAMAGLLLGIINCAWAGVGGVLDRLDPSPALRPIIVMLLCGVIPSAVVGVLLAFTSTKNEQRWLIFLTNAGALLFVTFLLIRRM